MRPDFLVIGAGKCGTTSLCASLAQHPDVFISDPKEPNFLSDDDLYDRGWDWYEELFSKAPPTAKCGEGSVSYTYPGAAPKIISRIHEGMPDAKLIYLVRHPLSRVVSAYREMHTNQHSVIMPYSLRRSMDVAYEELIAESKYYERILPFLDAFSENRLHILFLEDLTANPQRELEKCYAFIGVPFEGRPPFELVHLNAASAKLQDTPVMRLLRKSSWLLDFGRKQPGLAKLVKPFVRRPLQGPTEWDGDSHEYAVSHLQADAMAFLELAGKPPTFWDFDRQPGKDKTG